jgi:hypothetical protein
MSVHQNYIKASDLMLITTGLGVINFLLIPETFSSGMAIFIGLFTLLFLLGLSLFIRKGISWIKYLLLVLAIPGIFLSIPFLIKNLGQNPAVGVINIIQTVFQFWALILLFKIPKEKA